MEIKYFFLISLSLLSSVSKVSTVYSTNNPKCDFPWKNAVVPEGQTYSLPYNRVGHNQVEMGTSSKIFDILIEVADNKSVVRDELSKSYSLTDKGLDLKAVSVPTSDYPYATSGLYILKANDDSCRIAAKILVLQSGPQCETTDLDGGHGINQPFELKCSVVFSDAFGVHPCYPVMSWYRNGNLLETSQVHPVLVDNYHLSAEFAIRLNRRVKATYTCEVTFTAPETHPLTYVATNQPEYKGTCEVDRQKDDEK